MTGMIYLFIIIYGAQEPSGTAIRTV